MNPIVVLTTVDSGETGKKIASALVEENLVACVNIVPEIRSVYRWEGRVCNETELLLIIKTTSELFEEVRARIRSLHPYQIPEIIALAIADGDAEFLAWLRQQVRRP